MKQRKIWYRRYKKAKHFSPVTGFACPKIPLGEISSKGPDYEVVRVVRSQNCGLSGLPVLISWGLNIPQSKWSKLPQVLAFNYDFPHEDIAEIVLAV